jgi:CNT family concentrative nucleoside transporter
MSAPAAILSAKMLLPEVQKVDHSDHMEKQDMGSNVLEAITNGTLQGTRLAVNVAVMLLVFTAFIYLINSALTDGLGSWTGLNAMIYEWTDGKYAELSLQSILGMVLAPFAWLMGVNGNDVYLVGQLLGEKTVVNEFVAYVSLADLQQAGAFEHRRSIVMSTYILCGFANLASIGIQIGGIGALAPSRKKDLSELAMLSLLAGTMASLFTAVIVGIII